MPDICDLDDWQARAAEMLKAASPYADELENAGDQQQKGSLQAFDKEGDIFDVLPHPSSRTFLQDFGKLLSSHIFVDNFVICLSVLAIDRCHSAFQRFAGGS